MSVLLRVRDLTVAFPLDGSLVRVVREVDFTVRRGEFVGLVGESGSGKSLTGLSVLGLLPPRARVLGGHIELSGEVLATASATRLREIRGRQVAMVFQEPITALNPVLSVGFQIREALTGKTHRGRTGRERALELLDLVDMPATVAMLDSYPHQLSGGQRQRVMIAMALAAEPELLIADEPTSALDVTVQAQILELLEELRTRLELAILLITHDLSLVAQTCDRVMVMYAGQIVEDSRSDLLFSAPAHPYTRALIAAIPRVEGRSRGPGRLQALAGGVPDPVKLPGGCSFHPRCPEVLPACPTDEPDLLAGTEDRRVRCLLYSNGAD